MSSPARPTTPATTARRVLLASACMLYVSGLVATVALARQRVRSADDEVLRAEAASTAEVIALHSDPAAAELVVPGRWEWTAGGEADSDAVSLVRSDGQARASVPTFAADGWTPTGVLSIAAPSERSTRPSLPLTTAVLTGLLLLAAGAHGRVRALVGLAGLGLALTTALAVQWAQRDLQGLTDVRLAFALRALASVPDPGSIANRPGEVAQVAGLPFLVPTQPAGRGPSTVLPETRDRLEALVDDSPTRLAVGRIPLATGRTQGVRLALVPFEHSRASGWRCWSAALLAFLAALLPLSLLRETSDRRRLRATLTAWAFLAPTTLHLVVFTALPLAFAAWLSLHRWNLIDPARPFVGLDHYRALLGDGGFWRAIRNTLVFTLHVPVAMALSLALAVLAQGRTRLRTGLRAALFLPSITSVVAIAVVWKWILNDDFGILNGALEAVGLAPVRWLTSPRVALASLMALSVWMVVGYQMVLFQAGLTAIPRDLYDAARVDGAGPWRRFLHVTLPGLRHTLFFVAVTSVIGSFQVFGIVYVMTEGGPLGATDVAVFHIYREAWRSLRFGSAAAMSWVLFALIFAATWLHFRLLERRAAST